MTQNVETLEIAISVGDKLFRTYIETPHVNLDIFPSQMYGQICNFVYNLSHRKQILNRVPMVNENRLRPETMHAVFTYCEVTPFKDVLKYIETKYSIQPKSQFPPPGIAVRSHD